MNYLMENGKPEPKSACSGAWSAIDAKSPYSKKKIKINFTRSKGSRQPGECPKLSWEAIQRKQATAQRIERIRQAGRIRRLMIENPLAKRDSKGNIVVQLRQNGRFLPKQILMEA